MVKSCTSASTLRQGVCYQRKFKGAHDSHADAYSMNQYKNEK